MDHMRTNGENKEISQTSQAILDSFREEKILAEQTQGEGSPVANYPKVASSDYVNLLREVMGLQGVAPANLADAILPQSLLEDRLNAIEQDSDLKLNYPAGYIVQLAPIPFTYYGHPLSEDELRQGNHLVKLTHENQEDSFSDGYSQFPSMAHHLFPREFQECSFVVPPYDHEGEENIFNVTQQERDKIKALYRGAYEKLRELVTRVASE